MKIFLAPMEGVVDPVIRHIYSKIGGYDQMCTEFIRVTDKLNPAKVFYRYCPELYNNGYTQSKTPVFVQLLGGDPICIAENAALAVELGAPGIDLNFGCPAKKVNSHDGGAALLKKPERLFHIITAVKKAVSEKVPVTAKVRLGFEDKALHKEIAQAVGAAKADRLTIHARTKQEGYKPPAFWEYIAVMKKYAYPTKTVMNGEIWSVKDYLKCKSVCALDDVALGRGAFANPHLALQIKLLQKETPLTWNFIMNNYIPEFINKCLQFKNDHYALIRTKQWSKFLGRNFPEALIFFENIKRFKTLNELYIFINTEKPEKNFVNSQHIAFKNTEEQLLF